MNTLCRTTRLFAAATAAAVTAVLFSTVVSFGEPHRSTLMAKTAAQQQQLAQSEAKAQAAARAPVRVAEAR